MIRERREEDLEVLCGILRDHGATGDLRAWLEPQATTSWVYDMAPVTVAPTRNVVGHVLLYVPTATSPTPDLAESAGLPADDLLAVGRLLVARRPYDVGIARHLLREARKHVRREGRTPVLDLRANTFLTADLCRRCGFEPLPAPGDDQSPMIHVV